MFATNKPDGYWQLASGLVPHRHGPGELQPAPEPDVDNLRLPNTIYCVTIQVVSPFGGLLMLLAVVVVLALVTWIVVQLARRQGKPGAVPPELRARIQADSEMKVRAGLLMAEIAKKESIKIGDPEIEEGLKELAEQTGKNLAKLRAEYREAQKRETLIGMILENKVLDIIESKSKITES